jgi:hypothetical protein
VGGWILLGYHLIMGCCQDSSVIADQNGTNGHFLVFACQDGLRKGQFHVMRMFAIHIDA